MTNRAAATIAARHPSTARSLAFSAAVAVRSATTLRDAVLAGAPQRGRPDRAGRAAIRLCDRLIDAAARIPDAFFVSLFIPGVAERSEAARHL
jgi:hypothetical protein